MPRITVNVPEDVEAWLKSEADALGISKARAGGHCIEVMQNSVDHINLHRSAVGDDGDGNDDRGVGGAEFVELVERLEAGIEDLEDLVATTGSPPAGGTAESTPETDTKQPSDPDDPSEQTASESTSRSSPDDRERAREILNDRDFSAHGEQHDGRVEALLRMYDLLRERAGETLTKSDFTDAESVTIPDAAQLKTMESLWNNHVVANKSQGRPHALLQLPGVEPDGRGYRYTPPKDRK